MEVAALCIRLLVTVLTLLCAYAQKDDAVFHIVPNRLQFFEYESVTFHCAEFDGSTECEIVHEFKGEIPKCDTNRVKSAGSSCRIKNVYSEDSGEYWCKAGGGRRSSINITVTAGSVILESPARPVMEGEAVTLRCRNKNTSLPADFYKNGSLISNNHTGEMIINNVSKSDEGLYKCKISGAGESPESRLAVRELHEDTRPCLDHCCHIYFALKAVFTFVAVALLLRLELLHRGKLGGTKNNSHVHSHKNRTAKLKITME